MEHHHENVSEKLLTTQGGYRDSADLLRSRLCMLSGQDRLLMTMYWENGISLRQISRLSGIKWTTLDRRIKKLTQRLMEGEYITCLRNSNGFNKTEKAVAKDYFLCGLSMRKIADKRHLTYYRTRKTLRKIRQFLDPAGCESSQAD